MGKEVQVAIKKHFYTNFSDQSAKDISEDSRLNLHSPVIHSDFSVLTTHLLSSFCVYVFKEATPKLTRLCKFKATRSLDFP